MVLIVKNDDNDERLPPELALLDSTQHLTTFANRFGKAVFGKHLREAATEIIGFKIAPHVYEFLPGIKQSVIVNSYTFALSRLQYNFAFGGSAHLYKCAIKQFFPPNNITNNTYLECVSGDGLGDVVQNMLIPTWKDGNSFGFALDMIEYFIPLGLGAYAQFIKTYAINAASQNILLDVHKNLLLDFFGLWKTGKAASENVYNTYLAQQEAAKQYQQDPTQDNSLELSDANTNMIGALVVLPAALYTACTIQSASSKLLGTDHHMLGKAMLFYGVSHIAMFAAQIGTEFLVELPINVGKRLYNKWTTKDSSEETGADSSLSCFAKNESNMNALQVCLPQDRLYYNDTKNGQGTFGPMSHDLSYGLGAGAVVLSSMISHGFQNAQPKIDPYIQAALAGALFFKFIANQQTGHFTMHIIAFQTLDSPDIVGDNNNHHYYQDQIC